nr:protein FAM222B isoform X3 [Caretta caretta]
MRALRARFRKDGATPEGVPFPRPLSESVLGARRSGGRRGTRCGLAGPGAIQGAPSRRARLAPLPLGGARRGRGPAERGAAPGRADKGPGAARRAAAIGRRPPSVRGGAGPVSGAAGAELRGAEFAKRMQSAEPGAAAAAPAMGAACTASPSRAPKPGDS